MLESLGALDFRPLIGPEFRDDEARLLIRRHVRSYRRNAAVALGHAQQRRRLPLARHPSHAYGLTPPSRLRGYVQEIHAQEVYATPTKSRPRVLQSRSYATPSR